MLHDVWPEYVGHNLLPGVTIMQLKQLGPNQTQLTMENGDVVLFSYETPVAALHGGRYLRTSQKWSVTTSRHINRWLEGVNALEVPQSKLNAIGGTD